MVKFSEKIDRREFKTTNTVVKSLRKDEKEKKYI